jgi:hypothetical protein
MDTVEIAIHKPGEFDVPEYFHKPADWNTKEICLLTFTATHARLSSPDVPNLMNKDAHLRFFNLVSYFRNSSPMILLTVSGHKANVKPSNYHSRFKIHGLMEPSRG